MLQQWERQKFSSASTYFFFLTDLESGVKIIFLYSMANL